ncbi:cytochrome b/b6 domain-containing protein [Shewanella phaeophyticola]|uniref:Cytochrome b/b6 domain-containing protein n=1 Tax=Shewanella phaeophyticola TaxID=2978345 RepID=A0ABT2P7G9_9GAMM|nr:cytochrome b/b6 domain-containing protein [Shewanella sp. KJ10-1]MCT8987280.1 cytochrome b/b6 domain-containing protein [Shewanella sp. KJ10-1]
MYSQSNYPLAHRLLHWGLALTMLVMLLTVLLRLGWMEKNHMAAMIAQGLANIDVMITDKQAVSIAKGIRGVMFKWHIYFGYAVSVLVFARFVYMAKFGLHYPSPLSSLATVKQKFQAWVYWVFYAGVTISVITGLLLKFDPEAIEHQAETIHKLALWYFIPFISLHVAGIFIAESTHEKGMVSKMIGG